MVAAAVFCHWRVWRLRWATLLVVVAAAILAAGRDSLRVGSLAIRRLVQPRRPRLRSSHRGRCWPGRDERPMTRRRLLAVVLNVVVVAASRLLPARAHGLHVLQRGAAVVCRGCRHGSRRQRRLAPLHGSSTAITPRRHEQSASNVNSRAFCRPGRNAPRRLPARDQARRVGRRSDAAEDRERTIRRIFRVWGQRGVP